FTTATLIATGPHPPDGAESVDPRTALTWISGDTAVSHYVYLSRDEAAVINATRDAFRVNQWGTTYDPGPLELGATYYWRIDEIEADGTRHQGRIWSFTTSPKPIDLEIVGPDDVWAQSSTRYAALVRYEDDHVEQVTTSATWWLDTAAHAGIDETGLLTAEATDGHEIIMIRARYTEERITVDAEKAVSHTALIPGRVTYHVDRVNGDDSHSGFAPETAVATIQRAIDTACDGDTILVHPGIYTEMIDFAGKAVTVRSAGEAAIIECPGDFAVSFYSGEGHDTVLRNVVIRNSMMGVFITNSSPTITNVIITSNRYGLKAYGSAEPEISNCIFWDNSDGDLFGCSARYSWLHDDTEPGQALGLVSHWTFDETGGTMAYDSIGDRHGTVHGAKWTAGKRNGALSFDGNTDYVHVPELDMIHLQADYTVSAWIKTDSTAAGYGVVAACRRQVTPSVLFQLDRHGADVRFVVRDEAATAATATYSDVLTTDNWYHIVGLREVNVLSVYVNGMRGPEATPWPDTFGSIVPSILTMGAVDCCRLGVHHHFSGAIDEVMVFDRALSDEEIQQLHLRGSDVTPLFVDPDNGDYHLLSERGRYWSEQDAWIIDGVTSPCIDAGDPAADYSSEPTPNGGRINLGAYGGTAYASMSEWPIEWDFNYDGIVNFRDLLLLIEKWLNHVDWVAQ
ncbi:MAG: right-handed parallel beta-helix repeat-containing protein, partial [Phycisphaerales bacterium]